MAAAAPQLHFTPHEIDDQLKYGLQVIEQMQQIICENHAPAGRRSGGSSPTAADRRFVQLQDMVRLLTTKIEPHPIVTKKFLDMIRSHHGRLEFRENQLLISTISQLVSSGSNNLDSFSISAAQQQSASSTTTQQQQFTSVTGSAELSWVLDLFTDLMNADRSLIACIIGTVYELPLDDGQKRRINNIIVNVLDIVDEEDVPTLVRTLLKTMVNKGDSGGAAATGTPEAGLLSNDEIVRAIRLHQNLNPSQNKNLVLLCEVLGTALSVNPVAVQAFLKSIRHSSPSDAENASDSQPNLSILDVIVLLILLKRTRDRKAVFSCFKQLYDSGALTLDLLLAVISNKQACAELHTSIYSLCVFMLHNKKIFVQKNKAVVDLGTAESNDQAEDGDMIDEDESGYRDEQPNAFAKLRMSLAEKIRLHKSMQTIPWVYFLCVQAFRLYPDLQAQLLTCLLASLQPASSTGAFGEQNITSNSNIVSDGTNCIASDILVALSIMDGNTQDLEDGEEEHQQTQALEMLASYSNLFEDALHSGVRTLAAKCIHSLCFVLCKCSEHKPKVKENLIIFLRKQLFSGQDASANVGIIAASHVIRHNTTHVHDMKSREDNEVILSWILQVFNVATLNSNTAFLLGLLNHNLEFLLEDPDLQQRVDSEFLRPLMLGSGFVFDKSLFTGFGQDVAAMEQSEPRHSVVFFPLREEDKEQHSFFCPDIFATQEQSLSLGESLHALCQLILTYVRLGVNGKSTLHQFLTFGYRMHNKTFWSTVKFQIDLDNRIRTLLATYVISSTLCCLSSPQDMDEDEDHKQQVLRSAAIVLVAKHEICRQYVKHRFKKIADGIFQDIRLPLFVLQELVKSWLFCEWRDESEETESAAEGELRRPLVLRQIEDVLDEADNLYSYIIEREALQLLWDYVQQASNLLLCGGIYREKEDNSRSSAAKLVAKRKMGPNAQPDTISIAFQHIASFDSLRAGSLSTNDQVDDPRRWIPALVESQCLVSVFQHIIALLNAVQDLRKDSKIKSFDMENALRCLASSINVFAHSLLVLRRANSSERLDALLQGITPFCDDLPGQDLSGDPIEKVSLHLLKLCEQCPEFHCRLLLCACSSVLLHGSEQQILVAEQFIKVLSQVSELSVPYLSPIVYNCLPLRHLLDVPLTSRGEASGPAGKLLLAHVFQHSVDSTASAGREAIQVEGSLMSEYCKQILLLVPLCLLPAQLGLAFFDNFVLCMHDLAVVENLEIMDDDEDDIHHVQQVADSEGDENSEEEDQQQEQHQAAKRARLAKKWIKRAQRKRETRTDVDRQEHVKYKSLNAVSFQDFMILALNFAAFAVRQEPARPAFLETQSNSQFSFERIEDAIRRLMTLFHVYRCSIENAVLPSNAKLTTLVLKCCQELNEQLVKKWQCLLRFRYEPLRIDTGDDDEHFTSPEDYTSVLASLRRFIHSCKLVCSLLDGLKSELNKRQQTMLFKLSFKLVNSENQLNQDQKAQHIPEPEVEYDDEDEEDEDDEDEKEGRYSFFKWTTTSEDKIAQQRQLDQSLQKLVAEVTNSSGSWASSEHEQSFVEYLLSGQDNMVIEEESAESDETSSQASSSRSRSSQPTSSRNVAESSQSGGKSRKSKSKVATSAKRKQKKSKKRKRKDSDDEDNSDEGDEFYSDFVYSIAAPVTRVISAGDDEEEEDIEDEEADMVDDEEELGDEDDEDEDE